MNKIRLLFFVLLIALGVSLMFVFYTNRNKTPLNATFTSFFQLMGKPTKALDVAFTKVIPINETDEKAYGETISEYYSYAADTSDTNAIYLNDLIEHISIFSKKKFKYKIFVLPYEDPNAFALPGGVICVTSGLMQTMTSEAEIVSVLAHEMGHIELGHCFESVKYELLLKKINLPSLGQLADFTVDLFLRHSFSKTQEDQADEYSFSLLALSKYNPSGETSAFSQLYDYETKQSSRAKHESIDPIRDYFTSHPPLPLRIDKFAEKANNWWLSNPTEKRYEGKTNLKNRVSFYKKVDDLEWSTPNL